jgi:hypothetical protein
MKYPKDTGPQSQTEMYAWLFGMLSNAYNMLAQYEKDELQREKQDMIDMLDKKRSEK